MRDEAGEAAALRAGIARDRLAAAVAAADAAAELDLYLNHREEWIRRTAPGMAKRLSEWDDKIVSDSWERIRHDYRMEVWKHLDQTQRERIRKLRGAK